MRRNNYYNLGLLLTSAMTLQMLFIGELKAQSWLQPSPTLALTPFDQQTINIASGNVNNLSMTLDPSDSGRSHGRNEHCHSANVTITPQNAASFGVNWVSGPLTGTEFPFPSYFDAVGSHSIVQFPTSMPTGTYQIVLDATASTSSSVAVVNYMSSSSVSSGLTINPSIVQVGSPEIQKPSRIT